MTEYKPDVDNLKSIVEKAHFAITGDKDEQMKERLYAGVEAMVGLYQENPSAFYVAAAVALLDGTQRLGLKSDYANVVMKYLAQSMVEQSGYDDLEHKIKQK